MTKARQQANLSSDGNLFADISNDRVGIGSVVPTHKLHVAGTSKFDDDVKFEGTTAALNINWDKSDNSLKFSDSTSIKVGSDNDLQIIHDTNHSYLNHNGTGGLWMQSNGGFFVQKYGTTDRLINANNGAAVELFYNGNKKFETLNTGAKVTGNLEVTGVMTYDDVTSVDSVGIVTARLGVHIDDSITHIGDTDTKIRFPGTDIFSIETGGSERVRVDSAGLKILDKLIHFGDTDTAIRFPGADTFTVETAGSERFRIHSTGLLELKVPDSVPTLRLTPSGTNAPATIDFNTPGTGSAIFKVQNSERLRISSTGELTMTDGATKNFIDVSSTNNGTRGTISMKGKTSGGAAVTLKMGGFGDTARGEIFTLTNHALGFATNNAATQMLLSTSGKLGIGDNGPDEKLEVAGAINFTGPKTHNKANCGTLTFESATAFLQSRGANTSTRGKIGFNQAFSNGSGGVTTLLLETDGKAMFTQSGGGTVAHFFTNARECNILLQNDAQTWKIVNYDYSNNGSDHLGFHDGTGDRLVIGKTGRIGINETGPSYALHVKPASGDDGWVVAQGGTNQGFQARKSDGTLIGYAGNGAGVNLGSDDFALSAPSGTISLCTGGVAASNERIRVDGAGRLLVAKTSGDHIVDINATNTELRLTKTSTGAFTGIQLDRDASGNAGAHLGLAGGNGHYVGTSVQHDFIVRSNSNILFGTGGATERLRITTDKVMFSVDAKVDANNSRDLGASGARWKSGYFATGLNVAGVDSGTVDGIIITNTSTTNNGFTLGVNSSEEAFLWQGSNKSMNFATNNGMKMKLSKDGQLRLGDPDGTPQCTFDVVRTTGLTDVMLVKGNVGNGFIRFQDNDNSCNWTLGADDGSGIGANGFILYDRVNSAYRWSVDNGGNMKVWSGNIQVSNGQGIDFSAHGNAGGMTSEVLDDYEEGTYTPAITNLGNHNQNLVFGKYTKVGRLVTVMIRYQWTSRNTTNGAYGVTVSLPFTAVNDNMPGHGTCGVEGCQPNATDRTSYHSNVSPNTAVLAFRCSGANVSENSFNGALSTSLSAGYFRVVASYHTP